MSPEEFASSDESSEIKAAEIPPSPVAPEPNPVWVPIEGTVVNWKTERQVNPETGAMFDFYGRPVVED